MVVHDLATNLVAERPGVELPGDRPDLSENAGSALFAIRLALDPHTLSADHIEQDTTVVSHPEPSSLALVGVGPREHSGAQDILAAAGFVPVDQLFPVEKDEINAPRRLELIEVVGDLHEQGDA